MSEIPFLQALGDALEESAAARIAAERPRSRRRSWLRRRIVGGTLAFAVLAAGTAAATGVFGSHEERLATTGIACYHGPSLDAGATVLLMGTTSPVEACAAALNTRRPLTACAAPDHVAVLPTTGRDVCGRFGLQPIPAAYESMRTRVDVLARNIAAIERSAPCLSPQQLADRVQALLHRSGWVGWRTEVRSDVSQGPCATVSGLQGDGRRTIDGSLDPQHRRVFVFPGP